MNNTPNTLYVGNLSYKVSNNELEQRFALYGTVRTAKVIMDRESGRSKGFGFVEMGSNSEAQAAIAGLNGQSFDGRDLVVNEALVKESSSRRSDHHHRWHGMDGGRSGGFSR